MTLLNSKGWRHVDLHFAFNTEKSTVSIALKLAFEVLGSVDYVFTRISEQSRISGNYQMIPWARPSKRASSWTVVCFLVQKQNKKMYVWFWPKNMCVVRFVRDLATIFASKRTTRPPSPKYADRPIFGVSFSTQLEGPICKLWPYGHSRVPLF